MFLLHIIGADANWDYQAILSLYLVNAAPSETSSSAVAERPRDALYPAVSTYLPPTKKEVNAFGRVCLSVSLSVSKITQ